MLLQVHTFEQFCSFNPLSFQGKKGTPIAIGYIICKECGGYATLYI